VLVIINCWMIALLLVNLNYVNTDGFEAKTISSYCNNKKTNFIPNDLYIKTELSNNVFAPNIYHYITNCDLPSPKGTELLTSQLGTVDKNCQIDDEIVITTVAYYNTNQSLNDTVCPKTIKYHSSNIILLSK
jgi:hypothetical protein